MINNQIKFKEVRLVKHPKQGVLPLSKALEIAKDLDLILINSKANPPIVIIDNYTDYQYKQKKRKREIEKKTSKIVIKEIRFGPNTSSNDIGHKTKTAIKFLSKGFQVKANLRFKGRTIIHKEKGELILLNFLKALTDYGTSSNLPKLTGRVMSLTIKPKTKIKKK